MSTSKMIMKITTPKQFEKLVELMEQNPHLGRGYIKTLHKVNISDGWNKVSDALNKLGPPLRNGKGWMKVWADYKWKLKKKLIHNKSGCRATGGGSYKQFVLTPTEKAAVNVLQLNSIMAGEGSEPEGNTTDADSSNEASCDDNDVLKGPQNLRKRNYKKKEENDILTEQLKVQTGLYIELKRSLSEIARNSRKTRRRKEEQLKTYKEKLKRKDGHRKALTFRWAQYFVSN